MRNWVSKFAYSTIQDRPAQHVFPGHDFAAKNFFCGFVGRRPFRNLWIRFWNHNHTDADDFAQTNGPSTNKKLPKCVTFISQDTFSGRGAAGTVNIPLAVEQIFFGWQLGRLLSTDLQRRAVSGIWCNTFPKQGKQYCHRSLGKCGNKVQRTAAICSLYLPRRIFISSGSNDYCRHLPIITKYKTSGQNFTILETCRANHVSLRKHLRRAKQTSFWTKERNVKSSCEQPPRFPVNVVQKTSFIKTDIQFVHPEFWCA